MNFNIPKFNINLSQVTFKSNRKATLNNQSTNVKPVNIKPIQNDENGLKWHITNPKEFPNLNYTRNLLDWHDFIRRTPNEYEAWVDGVSKECEKLELIILDNLSKTNKLIFVDTNISLDTLKKITDPSHVLIMLADPSISVNRFFERPDREKQFLYKLIMEEKDPNFALNNFRECLSKINSVEKYYYFLNSGFNVILRDENRTIEETSMIAEKYFQLK